LETWFPGKTIQEKVDPVTGKSSRTVIESKTAEERPRISIKAMTARQPSFRRHRAWPDTCCRWMPLLMVEEGDPVKAGDIIAKLPRATTKTKDITGGLPGSPNCSRSKTERSGRIE
jgi:DNA-directed RNA polymerase subunit beta'